MPNISNAEKQARFRKKDELKKYADTLFRNYFPLLMQTKTPAEVRLFMEKTTNLPSNWSKEDYEHAIKSLDHFFLQSYDNPHQLSNDVQAGRDTKSEFMTTPEPSKFIVTENNAIQKVRTLSAHLISALNLSGCCDSDKAAALMEAVRFVGRSIASSRKVPKSQAITMCLASIGPQYSRPAWFLDSLATTLGWNLNKELAHELGKQLIEFNY